ncbi:DUF4157 domain-containing protein [Streptacidiphilus sp. P02-A3a]|uniref:eCIS core domain-containing protein n=1 Tax=Streptacidiphilus sp. P02-A3a TaxID=2704468 RepID=UPI0015FBF4E6|nr:DUF4157 domain-containing protein [Streptacidiphilus sp. P02-A3a]
MRAQDHGRAAQEQQSRAEAKPTAARTPEPAALLADHPSPEAVLALQRRIGNAAVSRMLEQARHEHGAGCGHQPEPGAPVQRSAVHEVLRGSGQPLAEPLRNEMESRLGADFSDVRLHTGATARDSAAEIGARAFTSGSHVVIGDGGADKHTLAHELTHVIQQRGGPVAGTDNGAGLHLSDPADRFERAAEANATRVMSAPAAGRVPEAAPEAARVQRAAAPTAGTPVTVARLMSPATFKESTSKPLSARSERLKVLDEQVTRYEGVGSTEYATRETQLAAIIGGCAAYENDRPDRSRLPGIRALRLQAEHESMFIQQVQQANSIPDGQDANQFRAWLTVLDSALSKESENPQLVHETAVLDITGTMQHKANTLGLRRQAHQPENPRFRELVLENIGKLGALIEHPDLPVETRRILQEIMAFRDDMRFELGGTSGLHVSAPGEGGAAPEHPYTLRPSMGPRGGTTELLGHLAHEMTHAAAHQSYRNTDAMLLLPANSTPAQAQRLAARRRGELNALKALFEQHKDAFSPTAQSLLDEKLSYGAAPGKVAQYARSLSAPPNPRVDEAEKARMLAWDAAVGDDSGLLVEYDTVMNQMLVYLHLWKTPADNPFYVKLRAVAAQLYRDRQEARQAQQPAPAAQ